MKTFPVSVIASTYHNRLLCDFKDYRRFLDYMTGVDVPLWDVADARKVVAEAIGVQIPALAEAPRPPEKTDSGNANKYVRAVAQALGADEVELKWGRRFRTRTLSVALKG